MTALWWTVHSPTIAYNDISSWSITGCSIRQGCLFYICSPIYFKNIGSAKKKRIIHRQEEVLKLQDFITAACQMK